MAPRIQPDLDTRASSPATGTTGRRGHDERIGRGGRREAVHGGVPRTQDGRGEIDSDQRPHDRDAAAPADVPRGQPRARRSAGIDPGAATRYRADTATAHV